LVRIGRRVAIRWRRQPPGGPPELERAGRQPEATRGALEIPVLLAERDRDCCVRRSGTDLAQGHTVRDCAPDRAHEAVAAPLEVAIRRAHEPERRSPPVVAADALVRALLDDA